MKEIMKPESIYATSAAELLKLHEDKVIESWLQKIDLNVKFFLFEVCGDPALLMRGVLRQIVLCLGRQHSPHSISVPAFALGWDSTPNLARVLLDGEEVIAQSLRECLSMRDSEWIPLRKQLNEIFHRLLRINSKDTCEKCRNERHHILEKTGALEKTLTS
jgi:hypothetical protein